MDIMRCDMIGIEITLGVTRLLGSTRRAQRAMLENYFAQFARKGDMTRNDAMNHKFARGNERAGEILI